jgi:RNA polymerase sigma factor (sigma-70 family)
MDDRELIAAMAAGDLAGIAAAYDKYAALLYGYCHWILDQPDAAAEAVRDTFVIATSSADALLEVPKLRPWLYSVARQECERQLRAKPVVTSDGQAGTAYQEADSRKPDVAADQPAGPASTISQLADATVQFPAIDQLADPPARPADADATVQFPAIYQPANTPDATLLHAIYRPAIAADVTLQFRAIYQPAIATDGPNGVNGGPDQAELRTLIRAILAELKPPEREVVELNLRHNLYDADLATALGLSWSRAHALSSNARRQLEKALGTMLIARTGRQACPALDALLVTWNGQLDRQTRDLVTVHVDHCVTCAGRRRGALRPAALSSLLPLAPLPPELREPVLRLCSATTSDSVAYRRRVVRSSESAWLTRFSSAIKWPWWDSEVAATVVVGLIWSAVAVGVALYLFVGYHPARAATTQPSARATASSPSTAATTVPALARSSASAGPSSASARPSPTVSQPAVVAPPVVPSASSSVPVQPSSSRSAKPSGSPSPKSSGSPSPKSSGSPSPKPSGSTTPSPEPSSSPTPTG